MPFRVVILRFAAVLLRSGLEPIETPRGFTRLMPGNGSVDAVPGIRRVPKAGSDAPAATLLEPLSCSRAVKSWTLPARLEVRCGNPALPAA